MTRTEILDLFEEIQEKNYKEFKGSNEADLHTLADIAELIFGAFPTNVELINNNPMEQTTDRELWFNGAIWMKQRLQNGFKYGIK
jgi:hypothetical protein